MIGDNPVELVSAKSAPLFLTSIFGAFGLMIFGPFLYTWATTPWAHPTLNPTKSLTGVWVGFGTLNGESLSAPRAVEGSGKSAMKLELHLKTMSLSRALVGEVTLCDATRTAHFDVLSGLMGQDGHLSVFTRRRTNGGGRSDSFDSLDADFVPEKLVVKSSGIAAVLRHGTDADFEQQCSRLRVASGSE